MVRNVRTHGTTGESPRERFACDELAQLKPYLSPPCVTAQAHATRKVDKTGLISWKANKYSVPMVWQQGRVGVLESGNQLHITDLQSGEVIARHELVSGKGQLVKNTHHYRDHAQRREQLEQDIQVLIGDELVSQALCQQLRLSLPKVYKDQLYAVRSVLGQYSPIEPEMLLALSQKPGLTATRIEQYLMATQLAIGIGHKAVEAGYRVLFRNALDLVEELELAEMKGELKKKISQLAKHDLLIIDELGYLPMTRQARYNLFQLINSLYEYRSIILTTNKDFTCWGEFFHDDNVAVPIIDRIIHHSHIFMLGGESYRLKQKTAG